MSSMDSLGLASKALSWIFPTNCRGSLAGFRFLMLGMARLFLRLVLLPEQSLDLLEDDALLILV